MPFIAHVRFPSLSSTIPTHSLLFFFVFVFSIYQLNILNPRKFRRFHFFAFLLHTLSPSQHGQEEEKPKSSEEVHGIRVWGPKAYRVGVGLNRKWNHSGCLMGLGIKGV